MRSTGLSLYHPLQQKSTDLYAGVHEQNGFKQYLSNLDEVLNLSDDSCITGQDYSNFKYSTDGII